MARIHLACLLAFAVAAGVASAQQNGLEEIVVTGARRANEPMIALPAVTMQEC